MGARDYFEFVQSVNRTCRQMARLIENREANADVVKVVMGGKPPDFKECEAPHIGDYRTRLQEHLKQLSRLETCGADLLGQLPVEKWAQAVGMLYLEDNKVGVVAETMGYSRRSVYAFAAKAFDWIDAQGTFDETVGKHFPEYLVGL